MHSPGGVPQVSQAPNEANNTRAPSALHACQLPRRCSPACAPQLALPPSLTHHSPPFMCVRVCLPRRDFRGPLTSLTTLKGLLLLATGNRIETCTLSSTSTISPEEGSTTTTYQLQRSGEPKVLSPLFRHCVCVGGRCVWWWGGEMGGVHPYLYPMLLLVLTLNPSPLCVQPSMMVPCCSHLCAS